MAKWDSVVKLRSVSGDIYSDLKYCIVRTRDIARMMAVKRFRRMNMCTLAFVCALLSMTSISWAFDPYEEIGVSSRASPEQIKKVNAYTRTRTATF